MITLTLAGFAACALYLGACLVKAAMTGRGGVARWCRLWWQAWRAS